MKFRIKCGVFTAAQEHWSTRLTFILKETNSDIAIATSNPFVVTIAFLTVGVKKKLSTKKISTELQSGMFHAFSSGLDGINGLKNKIKNLFQRVRSLCAHICGEGHVT